MAPELSRNLKRHCTLLGMLFVSTGCADAPRPSADPAMDVDTASVPIPSIASEAAALTLDGEGLRIFLTESGSARPLAFGSSMQETLATLTRVLGSPPEEFGESADCGMRFVRWRGLTTWFTRDEFSGWSVNRDSELTTVSGIGLGSTRSELLSVYAADVHRSTLGEEFAAGGLAGILESANPDARITNLWAGTACLAR